MLLYEKQTERNKTDVVYGRFTHDQLNSQYALPDIGKYYSNKVFLVILLQSCQVDRAWKCWIPLVKSSRAILLIIIAATTPHLLKILL